MKPINDVKEELKQLFQDRGWMYEIEGQSPPYYNIYSAITGFIEERFYKGKRNNKQTMEDKMEYSKTGYSRCSKCNIKRVYYRVTTNDFRCRKCGNVFKVEAVIKAEQKIKENIQKSEFVDKITTGLKQIKSGKGLTKEQVFGSSKAKEINCGHYKGDGYYYKISDNEILSLCDQCNLNLAMELMKQMAVEVFAGSMMKKYKM